MIYGKWTECLWCIDPYSYENYKKNERKGGDQKKPKPVRFMKKEKEKKWSLLFVLRKLFSKQDTVQMG